MGLEQPVTNLASITSTVNDLIHRAARAFEGKSPGGRVVDFIWSKDGIAAALGIAALYYGAVAIDSPEPASESVETTEFRQIQIGHYRHRLISQLFFGVFAVGLGIFLGQRHLPKFFDKV